MRRRRSHSKPGRQRKDSRPAAESRPIAIPITRERLKIRKQARQTRGVAIRIYPAVRIETVDLPLRQEQVQIERVPINRVIEKSFAPHQEGDTTVVPVFEEVLTVQKQLMLKEELRITRRRTTQHHRRDVPLRTEQVQVTRLKS